MNKILLYLSALCFLAALILGLSGATAWLGPALAGGFGCVALLSLTDRRLSSFSFTLWVFTFVALSLTYPQLFRSWGGFETKKLISPLIQIIMFGMGTTLSLADFARVLKMPKAVVIGVVLHYIIMPFSGWTLATVFGFEPEVGAGVILVGSCPSGVASNVLNYLAGADVALSVTMTAVSTMISPITTSFMMKLLAGRLVPISFPDMLLEILKIVIIPTIAGIVVNQFFLRRAQWLHKVLPVVSMMGICLIIAIITSLSRDKLLSVGPALIGAVMIHNLLGYLLGYWGARALGLGEKAARTISIEAGVQNGGMASALAISVLNSANAGLGPAVFGPWQNISGSMLANWWNRRPPKS